MHRKFIGLIILTFCLILSDRAFAADFKLGCINMRKVFYEYKKTKDFNQKLESEDAKVRGEIEAKTEKIRKVRDEIDLLSEEAKGKKEPQLKEMIKELDEYKRTKVEELIQKKDEMFKEIRTDILDVASLYAKKNGYDLMFDEAIFVYYTEKYDVTDNIIKELNK